MTFILLLLEPYLGSLKIKVLIIAMSSNFRPSRIKKGPISKKKWKIYVKHLVIQMSKHLPPKPPEFKRKLLTKLKKPFKPAYPKPSPPKKSFPNKKKQPFKTPITCFKCGKPRHKATECKVEQKVNELFADKPHHRDKV